MAARILACVALLALASFCKDPNQLTPEDFLFKGLDKRGDTNNRVGSKVTLIDVNMLAALNTLGVSMARVDYDPYGLNPPHIHPRATEVQTLIKGTLYVGFVTSNDANGNNKFVTKVLYPGDVFVFPQGLIHFQFNIGDTPAMAISGLSSQNPGVITIANATFGSNPPISPEVLSKAFQLDKSIIKYLQSTFAI
ncbi:hypothetical protein V2J09_018224 [Rumex salicifolius]